MCVSGYFKWNDQHFKAFRWKKLKIEENKCKPSGKVPALQDDVMSNGGAANPSKLANDLGKRLLEAARLGHSEEVTNLMKNGAPLTTDWVRILNILVGFSCAMLYSWLCFEAYGQIKWLQNPSLFFITQIL